MLDLLVKTLFNLIKTIFVVVIMQGCATPYYGYSKSDWDAMSEIDKVAIKEEYEFIKNTQAQQKHKDIIGARTQSIIDRGVKGRKY